MKVLITKALNSSWYYHKVGEIVEVKLVGDNYYKYINDEHLELLIKIKDCEVVYSNGQSSIQIKEKYMSYKMYLKSIAVRFENTKQRQDIEKTDCLYYEVCTDQRSA